MSEKVDVSISADDYQTIVYLLRQIEFGNFQPPTNKMLEIARRTHHQAGEVLDLLGETELRTR